MTRINQLSSFRHAASVFTNQATSEQRRDLLQATNKSENDLDLKSFVILN